MREEKKFKRTIEDFICEKCGRSVAGNGFTNHCPECLWSKHVDVHPGDRKNDCGGLMEPVDAYFRGGVWFIMQKCNKCGYVAKIKSTENDSLTSIEKIIERKIK